MADLADRDLVVEDIEVKRDVFADPDDVTGNGAVLATNTSTLSSTSIASATDRPDGSSASTL